MLMPHFELVLVVGRGSRTCLARAGGRVLEAITVISDIAQVNVPNSGGVDCFTKAGGGAWHGDEEGYCGRKGRSSW